ncbi:RICIN domain-containing protein [Bradyrhizobium sp. Pa8]|uniref:RICIN domain-containing protein n=1 Tax=Bradyrhizobium sp. Pa8 TaxID=3386552 RepID=UPI00403F5274
MNNFALRLIAFYLALTGASHAQQAGDTYAIQNLQSGKNLRPYAAKTSDGNAIILYDHWSWKCMTWQFVRIEGNTYQLRNLHTSKTLEPSAAPAPGTTLWQQPLGGANTQNWEFIPEQGGAYLIKLKGAPLFITASSPETNSPIVLLPRQNSSSQRWRLIEQNPWF